MEWVNSTHIGEVAVLPQISISTITTTLKLNCKFNLINIYRFVKLDCNNIIGFKCNGWVRIKLGENITYLPPNTQSKDSDDESEEEEIIVSAKNKPKKLPSPLMALSNESCSKYFSAMNI